MWRCGAGWTQVEIPLAVGGGSVPVVLPGVANMAGNPPGAQQGRDETWRRSISPYQEVPSLNRIKAFYHQDIEVSSTLGSPVLSAMSEPYWEAWDLLPSSLAS